MSTLATPLGASAAHPVDVQVEPCLEPRNRLTAAFRPILALPHALLVGAPIALTFTLGSSPRGSTTIEWGSGGVLGAAAAVAAIIAWFAILFTGRHPEGLWALARLYLRWRVRAVAYMALLRDEYPPFGEGRYPAALELRPAPPVRDRLSVAFRPVLAIPHLIVVWALGMAWICTTIVAWVAILFTGRYPRGLYHFGVGVLRWTTRVEAYLLLLHDEYPPFSLG